MTGPISFRPTPPTATPTTSTPIQRSAPINAPPAPPPPPPVRSPQAFQRSATASGSRPLDLQAEAASINTAITQANPEQIQANAARLNQLGLVPQGMSGITPAALQTARQNLKPVSQHQVLNLHDAHESDASRSTVVESGRSVKLKQGGSPFGVGIVLKPGATVEVLGHGSPDGKTIGGKTPQQLAKQLKAGGATQLAVLDLKSCHSEAFKAELQQCLASEGIQVGQIKTYQGSIAISRATGNVAIEGSADQVDGFLGYTVEQLLEGNRIAPPTPIPIGGKHIDGLQIVPFVNGSAPAISEPVVAAAEACSQAYSEYASGQLINNLVSDSGVFLSAHVQPFLQGNEADLAKILDAGMLSAKFGYLIEDRMTQILQKSGKFDASHFQQTIGGSRPDIVVGHLRVDITSSESLGHILHKDPKAWFSQGNESFEITYPSIKHEHPASVLSKLSGEGVDIDTLTQAKEAFALEKQGFLTGMDGVRSLLDEIRSSNPKYAPGQLGHLVLKPGQHRTLANQYAEEDAVAAKLFPSVMVPESGAHPMRSVASNLINFVAYGKYTDASKVIAGATRLFEGNGLDSSIIQRHLFSGYSGSHEAAEYIITQAL